MNALADLSPAVLAGLIGLVVVQLALQIAALISLVRTPAARITLGGRKWAWAIVIVLGEIVGPIVYFAAGKSPAPAEEPAGAAPASQRAARAADTLYGSAPGTACSDDPSVDDAAAGADGTGMGELP